MRIFLIILVLLLTAYYYYPNFFDDLASQKENSAPKQTLHQKQKAFQQSRVYERYPGNFVKTVTWSEADDRMALIEPNGYRPFYIDVFEATIAERRAWSVAGQKPTTKLLFKEAKEACQNAGKRLCAVQEWQVACRGGRTKPFYFNNTRALKQRCDFARSAGYDKNDYVNKNNTHPQCRTSQGLHHMIGNVAEMTVGPNGKAVIMGMTYYDQHYRDPDNALRMSCEHIVHKEGAYSENRHNEGMGFRCCKDAL